MLKYMLMPFRRFADFKGRSRRMEFWAFTLFNMLVYTALVIVALTMGLSISTLTDLESGIGPAVFGSGFMLLAVLGGLFGLVVIIPSIAVTVRRLHDRDMSGWWYLGFIVLGFLPLVGWLASVAFFIITLLPGTRGDNRYGSDPKDPLGAEIFA